jgi:hypothetical protein
VSAASSPSWAWRSQRPLSTRSCVPRASIPRRAGTARPGGSSCTPRPPESSPSTSPRRHRAAEQAVGPGVHRARHPTDAPRRRHHAPDRRLDSPASPQPRPPPRRAVRGPPVLNPRPRLELHPLLRCGIPGCQRHNPAHCRAGAEDERDLRPTHRDTAPRTPRPQPDSRRDAPARRPS